MPGISTRRHTPAAVVLAAVSSLALLACGGAGSAERAPAEDAGPNVALAASVPSSRLLLTGELRAVRNAVIRAPRPEVWPMQIRWMIPEGTEVAEGQEVVQFDNTGIVSRLEEQRLARLEAAIRLRSREAGLVAERAEKSYAVERARIELEKARLEAGIPAEMRPRRTFEEKRIALEKAEAALAKAEAELAAFEAGAAADLDVLRVELEKAERNIARAARSLEEMSVRAPRAGVLVYGEHPWESRKFQVGDNVWPQLTIMLIPDLAEMEVLAWLADADDGAVEEGRRASCRLDSYPGRVFGGRVKEVAALSEERGRDTGLRAFRVVVGLDGSDPSIMRPGMSVKVELERART